MICKTGSIIASFYWYFLLSIISISKLRNLVIPMFFYWLVTFFIDTGLGNGFRNKFAEAKVLGNFKDTQAFVRPAYFFIGGVSLFLVVVYFIVNQFIDWLQLFNANASLQGKTSFLLPIIFAFFCLQLVVKLITSIY
jgi:hypothetical protein